MGIICLIITVPLLLYHIVSSHNLFNPNLFMYGIWTVIVGLNCLHMFGINDVSEEAYLMVLLGIIGYFIGELIAISARNIYFIIDNDSFYNRTFVINYRLIYGLCYITIALLLIDTLIAANHLMSGLSFTQVRLWLTETYEGNANPIFSRRSYIEQVFRILIVAPFQMALNPLCAIDFFFGERNRKLLWFTIIIQGFSIISGGGARFGIIILALSFAVTYSIFKCKNISLNRELVSYKRRKMMRFIVVGIILVGIITTQRTSVRLVEEAYFYFALCLPLLSIWIPAIETLPHTYGMVSLFGITRIPFLILDRLGIYSSPVYADAYNYIVQANTFKNVASGIRVANSFVTPYYYLYIDGGYIAIVVGMMMIGLFANRCYRNVMEWFDYKSVYLILLVDIGLFYSFIRLELTATNYFLALLALPLLFKKMEM
ncbi:hypothetical protein [Oribacterium sp. WCC10]|uniref:hypothetical protein n=1 Tax=Oribacterium sp. WCC10 TaxID=1855343 RepID=UPI0008ED0A59|nr:hypothetical protein [Oribacterium sp. WCC10]SFG64082.1 hypothetical protein SAMN05216356_11659 [Oribacterium sp. WCC10]